MISWLNLPREGFGNAFCCSILKISLFEIWFELLQDQYFYVNSEYLEIILEATGTKVNLAVFCCLSQERVPVAIFLHFLFVRQCLFHVPFNNSLLYIDTIDLQ